MCESDFVIVNLMGEVGPERRKISVERIKKTVKKNGLACCEVCSGQQFSDMMESGELCNRKILFVAGLDRSGINMEVCRILSVMNRHRQEDGERLLKGSVGGVIVDGTEELFTKDTARRIVFAANCCGCAFPGKSLVEATGSLSNFEVTARNMNLSKTEAYYKSCTMLAEKLINFNLDQYRTKMPRILAVHASNRKTSNSLVLWNMVAEELRGKAEIEEVLIKNGQIWDCRGCKFEQCIHHGENDTCFYGGHMVEKVYPEILKSEIIVLICPNYNDSVSADIMAMINRLTAIYRTNDFSKKRVYSIVVSGYSGGDLVAQQILGAMNMNKNFMLPPGFAFFATANNPGTVAKIEGIETMAEEFAENILLNN